VGNQSVGELVGVGLGSNLGDRTASLNDAIQALTVCLSDIRLSAVYESRPVGVTDQPDFLNACGVGRTQLSPTELLLAFQSIERSAGRLRGGPPNGPRLLDIDLLLYGERVIDESHLIVPHPRLRDRAFVLVPLAELASDWLVPASAQGAAATVSELAGSVDRTGLVRTDIELDAG